VLTKQPTFWSYTVFTLLENLRFPYCCTQCQQTIARLVCWVHASRNFCLISSITVRKLYCNCTSTKIPQHTAEDFNVAAAVKFFIDTKKMIKLFVPYNPQIMQITRHSICASGKFKYSKIYKLCTPTCILLKS
jgi:hypothetical protein